MTGAGSGELLFAFEDDFDGTLTDSDSSGTAETYAFGRNPTLSEHNLRRQLQRLREPNSVWSVESVAQNFEGAVTVEAVVSNDTFANVEEIVFNSSGTSITSGAAQSIAIFDEVDFLSGTATRKLTGTIPTDFSIRYQQGGMVTFTLTMLYADEERNVSIPTADVTRISDDTSAPFHGFTLDIDATAINKLQSATLNLTQIARFQRGASQVPVDAVIAAPQATLDAEAIINDTDILDLAYGGSAATSRQDSMSDVTGTITISTAGGTTVSTYSLSSMKPDEYSWQDVVTAENDTTESYTFHINDGVTVS